MNGNETRSFTADLYLTSKLSELSDQHWEAEEISALHETADFIKNWTNLRGSILLHLVSNGEADSDEAQSRIQYWKDIADGKIRTAAELPSAFSAAEKNDKKLQAIDILEIYRKELAKNILEMAGIQESLAVKPENASAPEPAPVASRTSPLDNEGITVIDEDHIAEFVAQNSGTKLDDFYHQHLMPAYKSVFAEMQDKLRNKPAHIPLEKFQKDNEVFISHAEFLREQIRLVREKEPTVDNQIPVLTDVVEKAKPVEKTATSPPATRQEPVKTAITDVPQETGKPSLLTTLGNGLKSLFNTVARKILPAPRIGLGWGLATGAGLAAGVALATAIHTGDVHNHHSKQIKPLANTEPETALIIPTKLANQSLETPVALEAPSVIKATPTTIKTVAKPLTKLASLSAKPFSAEEPDNSPSVQTKPVEAQEFDIATFRHDLSTLEKACHQVSSQTGKSVEDGVCNGLQPQ